MTRAKVEGGGRGVNSNSEVFLGCKYREHCPKTRNDESESEGFSVQESAKNESVKRCRSVMLAFAGFVHALPSSRRWQTRTGRSRLRYRARRCTRRSVAHSTFGNGRSRCTRHIGVRPARLQTL